MMRSALFLIFVSLTTSAVADEEKLAAGKVLFESRCSGVCHQTPAIAQFNGKQWRVVLNTMQQRMTRFGMEPLTEEERELLLSYLEQASQQAE